MAHSKSARKRIRQNADNRLRNRSAKSSLRTAIKKFRASVAAGDSETAARHYHAVQKRIDMTAAKGIVHKRTAARIKSRLSAELARLGPAEKQG